MGARRGGRSRREKRQRPWELSYIFPTLLCDFVCMLQLLMHDAVQYRS
jgi:hypothetical protein